MDADQFWAEHDQRIPSDPDAHHDSLQYSLYRGMPNWFNAYFDHFQRRAIRSLIRKAAIPKASSALDIGCGIGRWTEFLREHSSNYTGFDRGMNAIRAARRTHPHVNYIVASLPSIPIARASQQLVLSVYVLQHLHQSIQSPAIRDVARTLKTGGYLIACESIDTIDPSPHVFQNTLSTWRETFEHEGFETIAEQGIEYLPFIKSFHFLRDRLLNGGNRSNLEVRQIGDIMRHHMFISLITRIVLWLSYPIELFCMKIVPTKWARSVCFLLRRV